MPLPNQALARPPCPRLGDGRIRDSALDPDCGVLRVRRSLTATKRQHADALAPDGCYPRRDAFKTGEARPAYASGTNRRALSWLTKPLLQATHAFRWLQTRRHRDAARPPGDRRN